MPQQRLHAAQHDRSFTVQPLPGLTSPALDLPLQTLSKAAPSEIPPILPHMLNCIRMVWNISRFYNTPERLTGLLRKVSNEIIGRCCAVINLDDIFGGDITQVGTADLWTVNQKPPVVNTV